MRLRSLILLSCLLATSLSLSPAHAVTKEQVNTDSPQTLTNKTITSPSIGGTVSGGATYTAPTITGPSITGTVGGSATYTTPSLSGATFSATKTFDTKWESAEKYVDLAQAVSQLGSTVTTLVVTQPKTITANITFPSTLSLQFVSPGKFTCTTAGVTITVDGPVSAGFQKIFDLSGGCKVTSTKGATFPPQWWGAAGDGVANDTVPMQAMLDVYSSQAKTGSVVLPCGVYLISSTLTYIGNSAHSFSFQGACGAPGRGPNGAVIKWTGASGGTMIETKGANQLLIRNIALDGNALAKWGFSILSNEGAGGSGSSGLNFENVFVGSLTGVNSACYRLGDSNFQVSEIKFIAAFCQGSGTPGTTYYGIWSGHANVKNFRVFGGDFGGLRYGITHGDPSVPGGGSGYMEIIGTSFNHNTFADVYSGGGQSTNLRGCGSEESKRLLEGTVGTNINRVTIEGCYFDSTAVGTDDIVITNTGKQLTLIGNDLRNRRTASSIPKIEFNAAGLSIAGAGSPRTSFISLNNYYHLATGFVPAYDNDGSSVFAHNNSNHVGKRMRVISFGDMGGNDTLSLQEPLTAILGEAPFVNNLNIDLGGIVGNANIVVNRVATPMRATTKFTINKEAWTAAATTQDIDLVRWGSSNAHVVKVVCDTTQAFAGLAGTIQLQVGSTSGGTEYILAHDVKTTAVVKGQADADLGANLSRATAVQGGHFVIAGDIRLWIRLTSGTGNIGTGSATNLSAGSVTIYVTYETRP